MLPLTKYGRALTVEDFCVQYGIRPNFVHNLKSIGAIPPEAFYDKHRIYPRFFILRKSLRTAVKKYVEDMYYIVNAYKSNVKVANEVSRTYGVNANTVVGHLGNMFAVDRTSILSYKVNETQWALFKYYRKVERHLKLADSQFTIQKALDNMMKEA